MSGRNDLAVGKRIPEVDHPVSMSLPTWDVCVAVQEGESWVIDKLIYGYPRFYIHPKLDSYRRKVIEKHFNGDPETVLLLPYPTEKAANECRRLILSKSENPAVDILIIAVDEFGNINDSSAIAWHVVFPIDEWLNAKSYWRWSGQIFSSRMAEYYLNMFGSLDSDDKEVGPLIETGSESKKIIKNRIATLLNEAAQEVGNNQEKSVNRSDVFLFPTGMAAVYNAHQLIESVITNGGKSVCFGFPFVDSLAVLRNFGAGVIFLGLGDDESITNLEDDLKSGKIKISKLLCETPSNPLLKMPNLKRLRHLADEYQFLIVIDDTLGNFSNISVLPFADIVVSSLTKLFSGACDVMGGSLVLNPQSKYYRQLKTKFVNSFEDLLFAGDAHVLELNSRDFKRRSEIINKNAIEVVDLLANSPEVLRLYYPSLHESKKYYDEVKTTSGGYGGLISVEFRTEQDSRAFYDALEVSKGPSLGTNFTLSCPFTLLAHYKELDEIKKWGVPKFLIRLSVGLEDIAVLKGIIQESLNAVKKLSS